MKPIETFIEYNKFGFVLTRTQAHLCPSCGELLNAGEHYHPTHCPACGEALDFSEVIWKPEEELYIDHDACEEFFNFYWETMNGKKGA